MAFSHDKIERDSRSYRQGLVLGLTLAEVFLLLVFALLIGLAALWQQEKNQRLAAEHQLTMLNAKLLDPKTTKSLEGAFAMAGHNSTLAVLDMMASGIKPEKLTTAEQRLVEETRRRWVAVGPSKIDDDWQTLVRAIRTPADELKEAFDAFSALKQALPKSEDRKGIVEVIKQGEEAKRLYAEAERKYADAEHRYASAQRELEAGRELWNLSGQKGHNWPPIINLSEAKGYSFASGKADVTAPFIKLLTSEVIPKLLGLTNEYDVDTIEVIGHTDEQKIAPRPSNMDAVVLDVLLGKSEVDTLLPGDNAGLGLARAVSVMRVLKQDGRLARFNILPLSGGQLIDTRDRLTQGGGGDNKERRRIEIRVRRSNPGEAGPLLKNTSLQ